MVTVQPTAGGPAGSAGLDLGDGLALDVDVAHPRLLTELAVELPLTGRLTVPQKLRRRLEVLLGDEVTALLTAVVERADRNGGPAGTAPEPASPMPPVPSSATGAAADGADRADVAQALHRAALAYATAGQDGSPMLTYAVGLLEGSVELAALGPQLGLRRTIRESLDLGVDTLVALVEEDLVQIPDQRSARALAALLTRVSDLVDDPDGRGRWLRAFVDGLQRWRHAEPQGQPALAEARADAWAGELDEVLGAPSNGVDTWDDPDAVTSGSARLRQVRVVATALPATEPGIVLDSVPGALGEAVVTGRWTSSSVAEVRIRGWSDGRYGLWARAFDGADDTPVALAPFRSDGDDAVAELLVPPQAVRRVEVDIVGDHGQPRPSPLLAVMDQAIHVGRNAARLERLGRYEDAAQRWRRCARLWDRVGDDVRARQARGYAEEADLTDQPGRSRVIQPLVCDQLAS